MDFHRCSKYTGSTWVQIENCHLSKYMTHSNPTATLGTNQSVRGCGLTSKEVVPKLYNLGGHISGVQMRGNLANSLAWDHYH